MARVTLADVAAAAGVSTATASHVLRRGDRAGGTIRVSAATAETVERTARELGYVPSAAGRGLARGSADRIAIMVPNLHQPYFARMAEALILALEERGLSTTLRISFYTPEMERDAVLGRTTRDVAGMILCPHFLSAELLEGRVPPLPVVQVGGAPTPGIDCVVMDEYEGALAVAGHLLDMGRRRLAYVADPWLSTHDGPRYRGYLDAHRARGLEVDSALEVKGSDWDRRETGTEAMVALLRSGVTFDAVMCVNDAVAVGAMRTASLAGLRIPQDVAFSGFDNTDEAAFTTPPLTSVDPGVPEMARYAVAMLAERLAGSDLPARRESAPSALVTRASTGV
ncbi:LacI family DNA-binding transcriptional regulator [Brachybacterium sp. YJGR34]|uniref:LacI family DNA-binding transcriptional regulator n=1 Tax=Brachybacterium sp. YJGR34 TaxID=2059911 RepID=UPI000E0B741D|nr:LacI family DNA-binding transcriptional regulator [Brachybacterium sp. YJGR34]